MRRDVFTADHEAFRKLARDFIEKRIVPEYAAWEKAGQMPREIFAQLGSSVCWESPFRRSSVARVFATTATT